MKRKLKFILRFFIVPIVVIGAICSSGYRKSDTYARNRIVRLYSRTSECTGVEIRAPSGKRYTLTAAHCRSILSEKGNAWAQTEDGERYIVSYVLEDEKSDLMLLTAAGPSAFTIATETSKHEHVHTMTHGDNMPAFRTDGELLEERLVDFPLFVVGDQTSLIACSMPKYQLGVMFSPNGPIIICSFHMTQLYTTAMVLHGSSGGPLLDANNRVIGIVSTLQETGLSTFVTLKDIQKFLKGR